MRFLMVVLLLAGAVCTVFIFRKTPAPRNVEGPVAGRPQPSGSIGESIALPVADPKRGPSWHSVESADYIQYIANLRKIGCPEETVRDIVVVEVCKFFGERRSEAASKFPFWLPDRHPSVLQAKALEAEIDREEGAVIQKLLGIPWNGIEDYLGRNGAGYLSLHKASQVQRLKKEFEAAQKKIEAGAPNRELTSAEEKAIEELQKNFEKNLAALLTPEEMQEYKLHHSHDSTVLRRNLLSVDVSEQEFREMYQRRQELNELIASESSHYASDESARERVSQGIKGFEQSLANLLGPERYADYQRGEDNAYQRLRQYADSAGVPETEANALYEYKRKLEAVNRMKELTPEERANATRVLRREAAAVAEQKLGTETYQAYLRRGGDWLKVRD